GAQPKSSPHKPVNTDMLVEPPPKSLLGDSSRMRRMYSFARRYPATVWHFCNGVGGWRRYRSARPLTFVVLGMHRSGTSCVTRMINGCGASLGVPVIP